MSLFLNFFSNEIAIQTHIFLQNLASIQPRTSPQKFAGGVPRRRVRRDAHPKLPSPFGSFLSKRALSVFSGADLGALGRLLAAEGIAAHLPVDASTRSGLQIRMRVEFEFRTYLNCRTYTIP